MLGEIVPPSPAEVVIVNFFLSSSEDSSSEFSSVWILQRVVRIELSYWKSAPIIVISPVSSSTMYLYSVVSGQNSVALR